jgi:hypothetical protein
MGCDLYKTGIQCLFKPFLSTNHLKVLASRFVDFKIKTASRPCQDTRSEPREHPRHARKMPAQQSGTLVGRALLATPSLSSPLLFCLSLSLVTRPRLFPPPPPPSLSLSPSLPLSRSLFLSRFRPDLQVAPRALPAGGASSDSRSLLLQSPQSPAAGAAAQAGPCDAQQTTSPAWKERD